MKAIVACALAILALVALVHGEDKESHPQSRPELEPGGPNRGLLPSRGNERICEPGSTKMIECNHCACTLNGTAWGCTRKACEPSPLTISDSADLLPAA